MAYTPTLYERETIIRWDDESAEATFYSVSPIWMRKLDKLVEKYPDKFRVTGSEKMDGEICSKTYAIPKNFVSIRTKERTTVLTDEQKAERAERLRQMNAKRREAKSESSGSTSES